LIFVHQQGDEKIVVPTILFSVHTAETPRTLRKPSILISKTLRLVVIDDVEKGMPDIADDPRPIRHSHMFLAGI
jgi:hypothetical protein